MEQNYYVPRTAGGEMLFRILTEREKLNTIYTKNINGKYLINDILKPIKLMPNSTSSYYFEIIHLSDLDLDRKGQHRGSANLADKLIVTYINPYNGEQEILNIVLDLESKN